MRVLRLPRGLVGRKGTGNGSPDFVPRGQARCPGMGDVGGQTVQLICSPALAHLKTAANSCTGVQRHGQNDAGF